MSWLNFLLVKSVKKSIIFQCKYYFKHTKQTMYYNVFVTSMNKIVINPMMMMMMNNHFEKHFTAMLTHISLKVM